MKRNVAGVIVGIVCFAAVFALGATQPTGEKAKVFRFKVDGDTAHGELVGSPSDDTLHLLCFEVGGNPAPDNQRRVYAVPIEKARQRPGTF